MSLIKQGLLAVMGFSSGVIISAGVFALITTIGVIPRLAQKSGTEANVKLYESVILAGGLFGCIAGFFDIRIAVGKIIAAVLSFATGIFFGSLACALAETLNVIPILTRRSHIQEGLFFFILALSLGKLAGSLLYFVISGFFKAQ